MLEKPSEIDSRFNEEHLTLLGKLVRDVRNDAIDNVFDPTKGDGRWGIGSLIYNRTINKIEESCKNWPWLRVQRHNLYCLIFVDGIPLNLS